MIETSSRCDHMHTYTVRGFEPFRVEGHRGTKPIMVDRLSLRVDDNSPVDETTLVNGHGAYIKANGEPGLARTATYSAVRIKIRDLPGEVRMAMTKTILDGSH